MLSILFSVSKIFRMDFGTVLTVWYFSFQFILPRDVHLHVSFFFTMWYWINIYCCVRWPHWNKILFLLIHYWRARAHSRCKYWKMTNGQLHITWILFSTKGGKKQKTHKYVFFLLSLFLRWLKSNNNLIFVFNAKVPQT